MHVLATTLELDEQELFQEGKHVLVTCTMQPRARQVYFATSSGSGSTAAHFAAGSSIGPDVNLCIPFGSTKPAATLVYYTDPEKEQMNVAFSPVSCDRNTTVGRTMMRFTLTLTTGNKQGMGAGGVCDIYLPPTYLRLLSGPSCIVANVWRVLGSGANDDGVVVDTSSTPNLDVQPQPSGGACYAFWMGGDLIQDHDPPENQIFQVVEATRACIRDTGQSELFDQSSRVIDLGLDERDLIRRGSMLW